VCAGTPVHYEQTVTEEEDAAYQRHIRGVRASDIGANARAKPIATLSLTGKVTHYQGDSPPPAWHASM
jgi:hypothetical protein